MSGRGERVVFGQEDGDIMQEGAYSIHVFFSFFAPPSHLSVALNSLTLLDLLSVQLSSIHTRLNQPFLSTAKA